MAFGVESFLRLSSLFQYLLGGCLILALGAAVILSFRLRSPGKSGKQAAPELTYVLQFPPSRRHVLGGVSALEKSVLEPAVDPKTLHAKALPTTRAHDLTKDDQYTPTGFSTQEIRALGRFPDYAILSGVPHPKPYGEHFDISKATFRPFRPFRWNYHQTMCMPAISFTARKSLMKFEPDWWVELEQNYHSTMAARQALLKAHPANVTFTYPGSELACRELMEMLLQFVTTRYPQYFALSQDNTVLTNRLLNTTTHLPTTPPLRVISDHIPEDYALMLRSERDGLYHLRAAAVCSSVGWDIGQHRNEPLAAIHAHVPDYASRLAPSMDRFFARMPADRPVQRCSWSLEDHAPLFSSPEVVPGWTRSAFAANPEEVRAEDLRLRCDWQTLRRLPVSGAVVFNFKAVICPFGDMRDEPYVPALLGKVLREGKENLITYKCVEHVRKAAMEALEEWDREQREAGVVPRDWEVGTLDESPFYPGWEERWRGRQGF